MATRQVQLVGVLDAFRKWFVRNGSAMAALGIMLVAWQVIAMVTSRGNAYFPSPAHTVTQTMTHIDTVRAGIITTGTEVVVGFLIAVVVGILTGLLISETYTGRHMTLPYLLFFHSIPTAILAPLFLGIFGNDITGVLAFVIWASFFPVFINTVTGLTQIPSEFYLLSDITGATKWQQIRYVKIWSALPNIASGMKVAANIAVIVAIVAEFIATSSGLGHLIIEAQTFARTGLMFGTLIVIFILGIIWFNFVSFAVDTLNPVNSG